MMRIMSRRGLSQILACLSGSEPVPGDADHGLRDKSADCRRAHVVGRVGVLDMIQKGRAGYPSQNRNQINASCAVGLADLLAKPL